MTATDPDPPADADVPTDPDLPTALAPGATNAIGRMLGLLGDEWTLLILQQAFQGTTRFAELKERLPISNAVLTARLSTLTESGLLRRATYQERPTRSAYLVTPRSRALWPVLLSVWEWERHWVPDHPTALPTMHHTACGRAFAPVLTCRSCGQPAQARDLDGRWGPSGSWSRSVPASTTRRRSGSDSTHTQAGLFPETMAIFGNRWSSALIGAAFRGITRFTDFETSLGAPPALLADRLRSFCAIGVLEPGDGSGAGAYRLTEKGRAFFPVVASGLQWAERWFVAPEGPALLETHRACGEAFVASLVCDQCRRPLAGHEVEVVPATRVSSSDVVGIPESPVSWAGSGSSTAGSFDQVGGTLQRSTASSPCGRHPHHTDVARPGLPS